MEQEYKYRNHKYTATKHKGSYSLALHIPSKICGWCVTRVHNFRLSAINEFESLFSFHKYFFFGNYMGSFVFSFLVSILIRFCCIRQNYDCLMVSFVY